MIITQGWRGHSRAHEAGRDKDEKDCKDKKDEEDPPFHKTCLRGPSLSLRERDRG
jgi:hypothetical protein